MHLSPLIRRPYIPLSLILLSFFVFHIYALSSHGPLSRLIPHHDSSSRSHSSSSSSSLSPSFVESTSRSSSSSSLAAHNRLVSRIRASSSLVRPLNSVAQLVLDAQRSLSSIYDLPIINNQSYHRFHSKKSHHHKNIVDDEQYTDSTNDDDSDNDDNDINNKDDVDDRESIEEAKAIQERLFAQHDRHHPHHDNNNHNHNTDKPKEEVSTLPAHNEMIYLPNSRACIMCHNNDTDDDDNNNNNSNDPNQLTADELARASRIQQAIGKLLILVNSNGKFDFSPINSTPILQSFWQLKAQTKALLDEYELRTGIKTMSWMLEDRHDKTLYADTDIGSEHTPMTYRNNVPPAPAPVVEIISHPNGTINANIQMHTDHTANDTAPTVNALPASNVKLSILPIQGHQIITNNVSDTIQATTTTASPASPAAAPFSSPIVLTSPSPSPIIAAAAVPPRSIIGVPTSPFPSPISPIPTVAIPSSSVPLSPAVPVHIQTPIPTPIVYSQMPRFRSLGSSISSSSSSSASSSSPSSFLSTTNSASTDTSLIKLAEMKARISLLKSLDSSIHKELNRLIPTNQPSAQSNPSTSHP